MNELIKRIKKIKWKDILPIWKLPIAFICFIFIKPFHKNLWLFCEDANEARDNGYWIYKYVREHYPDQPSVYAIKKSSPDYEKVAVLGDTIEYGSFKHWIYYLVASKVISSQKACNPSPAIFYILQVSGLLRKKIVFLQHGIIKDDLTWLYYENSKLTRFITGAKPEYEFVNSTFHYPEGHVRYTGLARFDNLYDNQVERKILIMPTWREWIADDDYRLKQIEGSTNFEETNYFKQWNDFLNDKRIDEISEKYHVQFVFYPHRNMQKYLKYFKTPRNVEILSVKDIDIQKLLKESALMITDYSSVFFDFIYMKKPIIFYQFDYSIFRENQYGEGYFDYNNNNFGNSYREKDSVFKEIETIVNNQFKVGDSFMKEWKIYFPIADNKNCERIYQVIKEV